MTTATDAEGLLDAIRAAPGDDAPRLIYADWCEENGETERAEFIRVQIRLVRMGRAPYGAGPAVEDWKADRDALRDREMELFYDLFGRLLAGLVGSCPVPMARSCRIETDSCRYTFRRGFVESVRCTLAAWQEYGPAVVRAHPVTRVELSDVLILEHGGSWDGAKWGPVAQEADAPFVRGLHVGWHLTEALAIDALSAALIAWANLPDEQRAGAPAGPDELAWRLASFSAGAAALTEPEP